MFARLELIERIINLLRRTLSFISVPLIERMWFFIVLSFIRKRKQLWIYFVWNKIFLLSKTKRLLERIVMTTFAGRVNLLYILANWILCTWYIIRYHIVHSCYKLNYKNKYPRKYISFLSISFIYRLFLHIYIQTVDCTYVLSRQRYLTKSDNIDIHLFINDCFAVGLLKCFF